MLYVDVRHPLTNTIIIRGLLQFAYNEISFMLIRLLQQVTDIKLVQEAHPEAIPPPGWADSQFSNGQDKARIKSHLTMYVVVRNFVSSVVREKRGANALIIGRTLGPDELEDR